MKNSGMMKPPRHSDESVTDVPASLAHAARTKNATVPPWWVRISLICAFAERQRERGRRGRARRGASPPTTGRSSGGSLRAPNRSSGAQVGERGRDERAADPRDHGPREIARPERDRRGQVPDRREVRAGRDDVDRVAGERPEHRGHQRLVVLQPAPVQHLEREDRGAERRAEEHGEAGRHAGDGQHPRLAHDEAGLAARSTTRASRSSAPAAPRAPCRRPTRCTTTRSGSATAACARRSRSPTRGCCRP